VSLAEYSSHFPDSTEVDKKPKHAELQFRDKSSRHKNFIWFDPNRDVNLNFYLVL
jgi:hypothetical protein